LTKRGVPTKAQLKKLAAEIDRLAAEIESLTEDE
jgi:hypothetical protein